MKRLFITLSFCLISILGMMAQKLTTQEFQKLKQMANEGNVEAEYVVGTCYLYGEGVSQSHTEAARWYREAAIQGFAEAQFCLGTCYSNGVGVTKSLTEAVKWWSMAANQGNAEAQYSLGLYYTLQVSYSEAEKWLRMAAAQGHEKAQEMLEKQYFSSSSSTSSSTAKSQDQTKSSSSTQAQRSVKRNNSGIITLKNHVFGFVSTPPSQCTISTVINEVQSKYGFKPSVTSGTLLTWNEITKPVGFDFVLNGKRLGSASFYQGNNYRSWEYKILELKTSTTFNASVNYVKQLQSELEAEGYVFEIKSSGNENYNVESRNKDVIIELDCCSASKFAAHDVWKVNINFRTK